MRSRQCCRNGNRRPGHHQSSSNGLSRSGIGLPAPGRSANAPRSSAWRICLSIQLSHERPGGLRSVISDAELGADRGHEDRFDRVEAVLGLVEDDA